jgi:hypothetical protein
VRSAIELGVRAGGIVQLSVSEHSVLQSLLLERALTVDNLHSGGNGILDLEVEELHRRLLTRYIPPRITSTESRETGSSGSYGGPKDAGSETKIWRVVSKDCCAARRLLANRPQLAQSVPPNRAASRLG